MTQQYSHSLLEQLQQQIHWNDRYKLLIKAAKDLNSKENIKTDAYNVAGCTAKTWLKHQKKDQLHFFQVDSESKIIKGLALLLLDIYNGKTADDIHATNIDNIFQQLDFKKHLSLSRSNGFYTLQQKMLEMACD